MERKLNVPIKDENLNELKAGDVVYLTGFFFMQAQLSQKMMGNTKWWPLALQLL